MYFFLFGFGIVRYGEWIPVETENLFPGMCKGDVRVRVENTNYSVAGGAMEYLSKLGKQAESVAGSFWGHSKSGEFG